MVKISSLWSFWPNYKGYNHSNLLISMITEILCNNWSVYTVSKPLNCPEVWPTCRLKARLNSVLFWAEGSSHGRISYKVVPSVSVILHCRQPCWLVRARDHLVAVLKEERNQLFLYLFTMYEHSLNSCFLKLARWKHTADVQTLFIVLEFVSVTNLT